jgi:hypothetical protein
MTYSPPGGGILVETVDKRGMRVAVGEDAERKAGYKAQIARLKKEMDDVRAELDGEKQK